MKEPKGNRIKRHRVPNLIQLAESYKNQNISPPLFFRKIENSLKLLQGPLYQELQPKKVKKIIDKNILSLRVTELARHKQYPFTCYKTARLKSRSPNERPISLPRMPAKSHYLTINESQASSELSQTLQNQTIQYPNSHEIQSIASNDLKSKSFDKIWKELEEKKQEEKRKKQQKFMQEFQQEQKLQDPQNYLQLTEPKLELKLEKWAQFSQSIVKGQQNIYEVYEKKLLEKVKLYRPKKIKFIHQAVWK